MNELSKLAISYGSDREPSIGGHGYMPYYYELFKGKKPKKILEIGIDTGRGLRMWREYFPTVEIVYGLDGNPDLIFQEEKITTFFCILSDFPAIYRCADMVGLGIDIGFDDGSHITSHQIEAARAFVPLLASGGVYIIEDVTQADVILANLPYKCEVREFDPERKRDLDDDRLVVIHAQ